MGGTHSAPSHTRAKHVPQYSVSHPLLQAQAVIAIAHADTEQQFKRKTQALGAALKAVLNKSVRDNVLLTGHDREEHLKAAYELLKLQSQHIPASGQFIHRLTRITDPGVVFSVE